MMDRQTAMLNATFYNERAASQL